MDECVERMLLHQLIEHRVFHVPALQRHYSWDRKQWKQLWGDVKALLVRFLQDQNTHSHFTGTVTIVQGREEYSKQGAVLRHADVVDGQQRLTTLILLLNALWTVLPAGEERESIRLRYVMVQYTDNRIVPRIELQPEVNDHFIQLLSGAVLGEPAQRSQVLLQDSLSYFREKIQTLRDQLPAVDVPTQLGRLLKSKLSFNLHILGNASLAGIQFELVNNRGKSLSEFDKLKNYLLLSADRYPPQQREALFNRVNDVWSQVFRQMFRFNVPSEDDEDLFLRVCSALFLDAEALGWEQDLVDQVKVALMKSNGTKLTPEALFGKLMAFLTGMETLLLPYLSVSHPKSPLAWAHVNSPVLQSHFRRTTRFLSNLGTPGTSPAIRLCVLAASVPPSEASVHVLTAAEGYAVASYFLALDHGRRKPSIPKRLVLEAHSIVTGAHVLATLAPLLRTLATQTFAPSSLVGKWHHCRSQTDLKGWKAIMFEYEQDLRALATPKQAALSYEQIDLLTIEHIVPESYLERSLNVLHSQFSSWLGTAYPDADPDSIITDISNLTLARKDRNSSYSDKSFKEKKGTTAKRTPCYANSDLLCERGLIRPGFHALQRSTALEEWLCSRYWQVRRGDVEASDEEVEAVMEE